MVGVGIVVIVVGVVIAGLVPLARRSRQRRGLPPLTFVNTGNIGLGAVLVVVGLLLATGIL